MGFFQKVKALFGAGTSPGGQALMAGVMQSGLPPRRGTRELLDAYSTHPWMHAAVRRIGENVAGLRWKLFKRGARGATQRMVKRDAVTGRYDVNGSTEITTHAFLDVLRRPNPVLHPIPFWCVLQGMLEVKGETPTVIERSKEDGLPLELWPLPPHWLQATPVKSDPTYRFQWNAYRRSVPERDVVYLTHPDLVNPYGRGRGTGEALADEIDVDEFAAKHIAAFFYNRGLPDVFIAMKGVKDPKQAEAWEERIRNKYRGSLRAWQAHVTNAELQVYNVAANFKDTQLRELREQQRDTCLQVWGVPPEVMGIVENSNRSTIDAADYIFTSKIICPRGEFLADYLTTLAQEWDDRFFVAFESPVVEDRDFTLKVYQAQPTCFSKNEWRKLAGAPPREGWDEEFPESGDSFGAALPDAGVPDNNSETPETDNPSTKVPAGAEQGEPIEEGNVVPIERRLPA